LQETACAFENATGHDGTGKALDYSGAHKLLKRLVNLPCLLTSPIEVIAVLTIARNEHSRGLIHSTFLEGPPECEQGEG
jgi:hypothetical protein